MFLYSTVSNVGARIDHSAAILCHNATILWRPEGNSTRLTSSFCQWRTYFYSLYCPLRRIFSRLEHAIDPSSFSTSRISIRNLDRTLRSHVSIQLVYISDVRLYILYAGECFGMEGQIKTEEEGNSRDRMQRTHRLVLEASLNNLSERFGRSDVLDCTLLSPPTSAGTTLATRCPMLANHRLDV